MSTPYTPTGLKTGGPCIFSGEVGPVEGSAFIRVGLETASGPQTIVKLSDAEDSALFAGIHLAEQSSVQGTADGDPVEPVTVGLVKALVRGGGGVDGSPLVTHTGGYLIAAVDSYSGDTNVVADLRLPEGGDHTEDGLAFVYLRGPIG